MFLHLPAQMKMEINDFYVFGICYVVTVRFMDVNNAQIIIIAQLA
jgi:hypothetical protein